MILFSKFARQMGEGGKKRRTTVVVVPFFLIHFFSVSNPIPERRKELDFRRAELGLRPRFARNNKGNGRSAKLNFQIHIWDFWHFQSISLLKIVSFIFFKTVKVCSANIVYSKSFILNYFENISRITWTKTLRHTSLWFQLYVIWKIYIILKQILHHIKNDIIYLHFNNQPDS